MSDAWRDNYDAWKLRSPDDEHPQEEQPEEAEPELVPIEPGELSFLRPFYQGPPDEPATFQSLRDLALELGATCEAKGQRIVTIGQRLIQSYVHGEDPEPYQLDILETSIKDVLVALLAIREHQRISDLKPSEEKNNAR